MTAPVLILGAGRGLGAALCDHFLCQGLPVIGVTRSPESRTLLRERCKGMGARFQVESLDIADRVASRRVIGALENKEPPTLAIYTAGYLAARKSLWTLSWDQIDRELASNLTGPLFWSVELSRLFLATGRGGHLFFSSGVVRTPRSEWGAYGVFKSAIEALSRQLALDLPPPLYSLSVNPGRMSTAMRHVACPDEDPSTLPTPGAVARRIGDFCRDLMAGSGRFHNGKTLSMEEIP